MRLIFEDGDAGGEGGVVAQFNFETHGKTKARADVVEVVVARDVEDALDFRGLTELDLHPFHRVLFRGDLAVPAELGTFLGGRALFGFADEFVEEFEIASAARGEFFVEVVLGGFQFALARHQFAAARGEGGVGVVDFVSAIERGENGLQAVIIELADGIELVVVALRALDGEAVEGVERVGDHVVAVEVARDFAVDFRLGHFGVTDEIPRAGGDETERLDAVGRVREKLVAGDLFLHETRVGLVAVERANHVIAIRPRVRARLVLVVTVRVAVVNDIKPVTRPAFAVARVGEQAIHQLRKCRMTNGG